MACALALPYPIMTCLAWEGSCLQTSGCEWLAKMSFSRHRLPPLSKPAIWRGGTCEESCRYTLVFCVLPEGGSVFGLTLFVQDTGQVRSFCCCRHILSGSDFYARAVLCRLASRCEQLLEGAGGGRPLTCHKLPPLPPGVAE